MVIKPPLRVLHCADFHFSNYHRKQAICLLQSLARLEHALEVDLVLIAGDVFQSTREPADFVDEVAECLLAFRSPLVAIPGNHDVPYQHFDSAGQLFALLGKKGMYLSAAEGQTVEVADGRLLVWGRGMPEHSPTNDPLGAFPGMAADGHWNVALAHGELLPPGKVLGCSSPIRLEEHGPSLGNVDYLALGHSHVPYQRVYGRTIIRYPGAASTIVGTGTVTLVDFDGEKGLSITSYSVEQ